MQCFFEKKQKSVALSPAICYTMLCEVIVLQFLDKYLSYWPILAASALFLLLGLWLYLVSERAMERSPKTLDWVSDYRKPGFPFRRERLPFRKLCWAALICVVFIAVAFRFFLRFNTMHIITTRWPMPSLSRYDYVHFGLSGIGAAAVYLCLHLLYESSFAAFWGALLFAFSPASSHGPASLVAVSLFFLLLWLRTEKPGFPGELLYYGAVAALCAAISVCLPAVWLIPALIAVHLWKLFWSVRNNRLRIPYLLLCLLLALLWWALCLAAAAVFRCFVLSGFSLTLLELQLGSSVLLPLLLKWFLASIGGEFAKLPMLGLLVDPLLDAPLFGLGLWGCVSTIGMVGKRRSVRGGFGILAAAALALLWLISGRYLLSLAFALTLGAMLKNADLGDRRTLASVFCAVGICYDLLILCAAWLLPLTGELLMRVFYL